LGLHDAYYFDFLPAIDGAGRAAASSIGRVASEQPSLGPHSAAFDVIILTARRASFRRQMTVDLRVYHVKLRQNVPPIRHCLPARLLAMPDAAR